MDQDEFDAFMRRLAPEFLGLSHKWPLQLGVQFGWEADGVSDHLDEVSGVHWVAGERNGFIPLDNQSSQPSSSDVNSALRLALYEAFTVLRKTAIRAEPK